MKEVCTQAQYAAIARTEKRFEVVADRMGEAGFARTASGVKLQWNRRLRLDSKFEDRGEKKRASGLTTSALRQGTKRSTLAATSLVATPSEGSSSSSRNGKRKAIYIESDNENDDDDDFISAPRPSKPAKRVRSTSVASSSAVPSTQDVAYYDLSTDNIITGSRASRQRRAPSITTTPARSSRSKAVSTISNDDNDDEEQEVIPAPKPPTRSNQLKRARIIEDDEDEEPSTAAPQRKRKRMSDFTPVNKYSKKDDRLLDRNNSSDYIEYLTPSLHYTRPISPEPAYNSKAYWEKVLRDRNARDAKLREEAERQRQAEEEEEEDDEDPIITTADRAKKSRELRRQNAGTNAISTIRSPSPVEPSSPVKSSSPIKPSSITKPSSIIKPASTTSKFSINNPFGVAKPPSMNRAPTFTRPAPLNRPSSFSRPPLFSRPSSSSNTRPSLTGRLSGSTISRSSTRHSSTTTSSPSVDNDRITTQRDPRRQQTSSYRRLREPGRYRLGALSPINEQTEHSINSYDDEDEIPNNTFQSTWHQRDTAATAQIATDAAAADQVAADEDMARQLHEEMNGPPPRSRRGRGFR
jgi:hypothetical protein